MKKLKIFLCLVSVLLVSVMLTACAPKITVDELKNALPTLVDSSAVLNKIYFGEGFDIDGSISNVEKNGGYFYCDTSEYNLNSILEIKEATEKVFTAEYAAILYQAAFEGTSSDISVEGARFIEGEMGLMQKANADVYDIKERVFDYKSIEIIKGGSDRVTIKINTIAGGKNESIEMVVARYVDASAPVVTDSDGKAVPTYYYRLDSPTY